jgi:hypothetical protein
VPFPKRRTPRLLGVLAGLARRGVPARGSPQTVGPSAAPGRTRVGRGGRATAASPASRRRHRGGLTYKNRSPSPPSSRHTERPAAIAATPLSSPARSHSRPIRHLDLLPRTPRGVCRRFFARHCAPSPEPPHTAAVAAGHRRAQPSVPLRPNFEHPRALGELLPSAPFPGHERRRSRRN